MVAVEPAAGRFLEAERDALSRFLPDLDELLGRMSLMELENAEAPAIAFFKQSGGPGLLIPSEHGGLGANPLEAVRVQRAIGHRCPSLAVAASMHHFSVATLVEMCSQSQGVEWMLLQAIAEQRLLVASGFAEGQPGRGILSPIMRATPVDGGLRVAGSKKPCSLSRSMDLLTASVAVGTDGDGPERLAMVMVPGTDQSIVRRPFWSNSVLAGAESDEVILHDVFVPERLVFYPEGSRLDAVQLSGFVWFELMIAASYVGIASSLVERALSGRKGSDTDRLSLLIDIESAMSALEGVARAMSAGEGGEGMLARVLLVRYGAQRSVESASQLAAELLGGSAFIRSSEVSYLLAAVRALAFHPPGRSSMSARFMSYLDGAALDIP
jgi:alkylation response protein AidB-like acyl-CoA dehydrogenase